MVRTASRFSQLLSLLSFAEFALAVLARRPRDVAKLELVRSDRSTLVIEPHTRAIR